MKAMEIININSKFSLIEEYWNPKIVGELNNQHVKLAKIKGEFMMHKHDEEDELFLVIKGELNIELKEKIVSIKEGEFVIIPKGVYHKPYSKEECSILLFEPVSTINTGTVINEFTHKNPEKI